jgi:hypothetical protein
MSVILFPVLYFEMGFVDLPSSGFMRSFDLASCSQDLWTFLSSALDGGAELFGEW